MRFRIALPLALCAAALLLAQSVEIGSPPGRLVDIGGRRLHLHCTGSGSPTVILEAGASAFAIDWALVQPEMARTNRVCSYDRARHGWSDPGTSVQTPARVVSDLHAALQATKEKPPYVMVGASMGGIYVRIYERRYPDEVVGMVLVDPSSEERLFTMYQGKAVTIASLTAEQYRSVIPGGPAKIPPRPPQTGAPFDRLPGELYKLRIELERRLIASDRSQPVPYEVVVESAEGERSALAELHEASRTQEHPLGKRPLVVLTRGMDSSDELKDVHSRLARISANSRHTVVANAGHEIHLFQPAAVIQAIRDVLEAIRSEKPLPPR